MTELKGDGLQRAVGLMMALWFVSVVFLAVAALAIGGDFLSGGWEAAIDVGPRVRLLLVWGVLLWLGSWQSRRLIRKWTPDTETRA